MAVKHGSRIKMSIRMDSDAHESVELVRQWQKRAEYVAQMMPYQSAATIREFVRDKIQSNRQPRALREAIDLARIRGLDKNQYGYSVHINVHHPLVKKVKPHRVLLIVRAKGGTKRKDRRVEVLEKHNPWTYDSLPFKPTASQAVVVARKASAAEVARTTEQRKRERQVWQRELATAGLRYKKAKQLKIPKGMNVIPDVALEALQAEFGLGGVKPRPTWRLAGIHFKKYGLGELKRDKRLQAAMQKLDDKKWKQGPPKLRNVIPVTEARDIGKFMRQLGMKV